MSKNKNDSHLFLRMVFAAAIMSFFFIASVHVLIHPEEQPSKSQIQYLSVTDLELMIQSIQNQSSGHVSLQETLLNQFEIQEPNSFKKFAFLIRTYKTSDGKINRFRKWIVDMKNKFGDEAVDVFLVMDISLGNQAVENVTEALADLSYKIFTFTEKSMLEEFPRLETIPLKKRELSYPWLFLPQPLIMWWNSLPEKSIYTQIWAIEDDTDLCGNIADFIDFYASNNKFATADLISNKHILKTARTWPHFHRTSPMYDLLIGTNERYFSREHFQRYSQRYMNHMARAASLGMHAPGEQFTPSLCEKLSSIDQCTYAEMETEHVAEKFGFNDRLTEEELNAACAGDGKGKLHHAMKW